MLKWIAAAIALLVLVIAATAAVPYVVDTPRVQSLISHSVTHALGRPVSFARLSVSVFPLPAVTLKDLQVGEDPRFGEKPFLTIARGSFRLRIWPLLSGRMEFSELVLEKPWVALIRDRGGRMNIASLGAAGAGFQPLRPGSGRAGGATGAVPVVSRIRIVDGAVDYTSRSASAARSYRLGDLNLVLQGIGPASPVQFSGGATLSPGDLRLRIVEGSLAVAGSRSPVEAPLKARVAIEGRSITDLAGSAGGSAPQIGGSVRGTLAVSGTLESPSVTGELEFPRLTVAQVRPACVDPKRRTLTLDAVRLPVSFANDVLTSQPVTTRLADGTITADVTIDLKDGAMLRVRGLAIRALPLAPVLVDYLCQGYAVAGPLDLAGEVSARPAALWTTLSGSGSFRIGAGRVVGVHALALLGSVVRAGDAVASLLGADLPASFVSSPLDFDSITATYTIRNGVVTTNDLKYAGRIMHVNAAGRYGLADGQMTVNLVVKTGRGELAATVTGSSASPSVRVNPGALRPGRRVERGVRQLEQGVRDLLKQLR